MEQCSSLFFLLLLVHTFPRPATSKPHNNETDLESLLAFKDHVADPHGILAANWTTNVSFCSWVGVRCSSRRQRVVALDLGSVSLQGSISPRISNLSYLSYLYLANATLSGPIPYGIGRLPRLKKLYLNGNSLSGPIPSSIFNMSSPVRINLESNNLTGHLPSDDLIILPQLKCISLSSNNLTGGIPAGFARCANLQELYLTSNEFSGSIPAELGNASSLYGIFFAENHLTGSIPTSIVNLTSLKELELSSNYLEGAIPEDLGNLPRLERLNVLDNFLNGSIPISLLNASKLNFLQLSQNRLTGPIPYQIGKSLPLLRIINLSQNKLTGGLEFITSLSNCRSLQSLVVEGNELEGTIPNSVGNLSSNHLLRLIGQQNRIRGKIPTGIGNLSSLLTLNFGDNELSGAIPSELATLETLQGMVLGGNNITGSIPSDIGRMKGLNELYLGRNALSGGIPDSIGNISGLQHLSLSTNNLFSSIPDGVWRLVGLLELNLSKNSLYGSLPPQVADLMSLSSLDLSKNSLWGNISTVQWDRQMLTTLDLSNNSFQGDIPQSLGRLINIKYMNLSHNSLSGTIPKSLAALRDLTNLDLSFNKLEGQIPEGRVFSNTSIPTLIGNADLCGAVRLGFSPCPPTTIHRNSKRKLYLEYIIPPIAFVAILLSSFYLFLKFGRKSAEAKLSSEDTPVNQFRVVSYNELVRATENFSDTNLLGKGGVSIVYKALLDDGFIVAVKVIRLDVYEALRHFDSELSALSMVRHRNLVKIISTCSNLDFKGLILQFMPNGSLEKWLYNHDRSLNLCQRISILVDVSLALEYLHHDHPQVILHRDLKPSNVLLDENMIAHVGDFGIAKLLLDDSNSVLSSNRLGTTGYMAPEYGSEGKSSRKGDVYSFGILVLETFTGKRPSDAMFCEGLTLRRWVSEAYPANMLRIVDCSLLRDNSTEERTEDLNIALQCVLSVIELGLLCSRDSPKERILMKEVVPILQKIKMDYLSKSSSA